MLLLYIRLISLPLFFRLREKYQVHRAYSEKIIDALGRRRRHFFSAGADILRKHALVAADRRRAKKRAPKRPHARAALPRFPHGEDLPPRCITPPDDGAAHLMRYRHRERR